MKFSATQIAGILEGKVEGNPNVEVALPNCLRSTTK